METYQDRLKNITDKEKFDLDKDFREFQEKFLELVPAVQPFDNVSKMLNNREIIIEERTRLGHPTDNVKNIALAIFAENFAEKIGWEIARNEDTYLMAMEEVVEMQKNPSRRRFQRVKKIFNDFVKVEPLLKCSQDAFRFYSNFAGVAFLCNKKEFAIQLLKKALTLNPDYEPAKENLKKMQCSTS